MTKDIRLPRPPEGCEQMTVKKDGWKVTFEKDKDQPSPVGFMSSREMQKHEQKQ